MSKAVLSEHSKRKAGANSKDESLKHRNFGHLPKNDTEPLNLKA
jgi:hypothetical protein